MKAPLSEQKSETNRRLTVDRFHLDNIYKYFTQTSKFHYTTPVKYILLACAPFGVLQWAAKWTVRFSKPLFKV